MTRMLKNQKMFKISDSKKMSIVKSVKNAKKR